MTTPNQAQARFLADHGVASVHDFPPGSTNKLIYTELASVPDIAAPTDSEPELTGAQKVYLSTFPDGLESMDALQREVFDRMGPTATATAAVGNQQPTALKPGAPRRPDEYFRLDTDRIAALHPTRRATLQEYVNVLNEDRKAAAAGIPPERREATRNHIEEAKAHATVYLAD